MTFSEANTSSHSSTCPCQYSKLTFSSATAAEYGDSVSLALRMKRSATTRSQQGSISLKSTRLSSSSENSATFHSITLDDGGITPLHLSAQHGHPETVYLILTEGHCDIDTGLPTESNYDTRHTNPNKHCGATPLHRAAFSGAIYSMKILLSWGDDVQFLNEHLQQHEGLSALSNWRSTNILAQDTSFGDLRTPLHKAVAGGRPMAVHFLLKTLKNRKLLKQALLATDSQGYSPLELAKYFTSLDSKKMEIERGYVRRWDMVSGSGAADWGSCQKLIEDATLNLFQQSTFSDAFLVSNLHRDRSQHQFVSKECSNSEYCEEGKCCTAAWENAFRFAMTSSMDTSLCSTSTVRQKTKPCLESDNSSFHKIESIFSEALPHQQMKDVIISEDKEKRATSSINDVQTNIGRACDVCGEHSIALFRSKKMKLVCNKCHRSNWSIV